MEVLRKELEEMLEKRLAGWPISPWMALESMTDFYRRSHVPTIKKTGKEDDFLWFGYCMREDEDEDRYFDLTFIRQMNMEGLQDPLQICLAIKYPPTFFGMMEERAAASTDYPNIGAWSLAIQVMEGFVEAGDTEPTSYEVILRKGVYLPVIGPQ